MESKPSVHLYLIRHGMTAYNQEKKYLGHSDIPVLQVRLEKAYHRLRDQFSACNIDTVISSDLTRCLQTAEYVFPEKSIAVDKRLREMNFGDWEGSTYEDLKEDGGYCGWLADWQNKQIPNGESWPIFRERVNDFIEHLLHDRAESHSHIAIVTHKGVIRELVSLLTDEAEYWSVEAEFGTCYEIKLYRDNGKWFCSGHGARPDLEKRR